MHPTCSASRPILPNSIPKSNQFLVRDDEPLLFHTGMKGMFSLVQKAVGKVLDPARVRWVGFSHFEADECGSLNEWLALWPRAWPISGIVGATVSINDFADRRARVLADGEVLVTGRFASTIWTPPRSPTPGMPLCSSRRQAGPCSAPTSVCRTATSTR